MRLCAACDSASLLNPVVTSRARLSAAAHTRCMSPALRQATPCSRSCYASCSAPGSGEKGACSISRPAVAAASVWQQSGLWSSAWQSGRLRCGAILKSDVQPERAQAAAVTRDAEVLADSRRRRRADSERDNRIAVVLLAAGVAMAAAGRWTEVVRFAREFLKPTDAAAAVFLVAAAWRMKLREQVKEGVDQLSALLDSVMLLGQLAQDIAVVKADIKQVRDFLRGVYERAAWLPGNHNAELSVLYATHK